MTDIPNTEYITMNANGVFVGGKPATHYRGKEIHWTNDILKCFKDIQNTNPKFTELHVLTSTTYPSHFYSKPNHCVGTPSSEHGTTIWCRLKFDNGKKTMWVFMDWFTCLHGVAENCAYDCIHSLLQCSGFRSAVFCAPIDNRQNIQPTQQAQKTNNPLITALQNVDLSKFDGKPVQLNGYEIVVRKLAETKQIKR